MKFGKNPANGFRGDDVFKVKMLTHEAGQRQVTIAHHECSCELKIIPVCFLTQVCIDHFKEGIPLLE